MKSSNKKLYLLGPVLACAFLIGSCGSSNSDSGHSNPDPVEPDPTELPSITTTTDWSAAMGTLTLDIEISHFTPTQVRLNPRGMDGDWVESD